MARRPKKNPFPKKTPLTTEVFQPQSSPAGQVAAGPNPARRNGTPHSGLTTNRQKPGGGAGNGGPTSSVG